MKKIWLEATHILTPDSNRFTGINQYTTEILNRLRNNSEYTFEVVGNYFASNSKDAILRDIKIPKRLFRLLPGKVFNKLMKHNLTPPIELLYSGKPDCIVFFNFALHNTLPGTKTCVVVHDLSYLTFPEFVQEKNRQFLMKHVGRAVGEADRIIAISDSTKKDLIKHYGVDEKKISIVYPGVDLEKYSPRIKNQDLEKYRIKGKYLLYLGTIEPRKNITGIIDAYQKLPNEIKKEYSLVLAGGKGWNDQDILKKIDSYTGIGQIIQTGYVDSDDIPTLYKEASIFLFPSHYEGFGIPILESMAAGTPVITSRNSSLPEVAGDAALFADENDIQDISQRIVEILEDEKLSESIIEKGYQRVKKFTWEKSVTQLEEAINLTLSNKP